MTAITRALCIDFKPELTELYALASSFRKVGNAGFDLPIPHDVTIKPNEVKKVNLGIRAVMENTLESGEVVNEPFILWSRSSIANTDLSLANGLGLIDSNYRGHIIAAFRNNNPTEEVHLVKGQRLVQLTPSDPKLDYIVAIKEISGDETERGEGGFGSTGK